MLIQLTEAAVGSGTGATHDDGGSPQQVPLWDFGSCSYGSLVATHRHMKLMSDFKRRRDLVVGNSQKDLNAQVVTALTTMLNELGLERVQAMLDGLSGP